MIARTSAANVSGYPSNRAPALLPSRFWPRTPFGIWYPYVTPCRHQDVRVALPIDPLKERPGAGSKNLFAHRVQAGGRKTLRGEIQMGA